MEDRYKAMVLGSFAADSLALGAHWIYDTDTISNDLGRVESFLPPQPDSHHAGKADGQFTHYGDQTMLLLEMLDGQEPFSIEKFADRWKMFMEKYEGYMDKASKETLSKMQAGSDCYNCGSSSAEFGGAVRIAPLLYCYRSDLDLVLSYVREQTAMTHSSSTALTAAEFLCRVTWNTLHGSHPKDSIEEALESGVGDISLELRIRNALDYSGEDTTKTIKEIGQACSADQALPGVVHLVTAYADNLEKACIENVMAGGDSAARGMAVGMILGAHLGLEALPEQWQKEMAKYSKISALLDNLHPTDT